MDQKSNIQAGQIEPVQLTLSKEAFFTALTTVVGTGKAGWSAESQTALFKALLPEFKALDGKSAKFTEEHENVLHLTCRQTEDLQRTVLRQTFAAAGYEVDQESENLFAVLFGAGQFAKFLAETENPATGRPFISQPKKKGTKKTTFAAVVEAATKKSDNTGAGVVGGQVVPVGIMDSANVKTEEVTTAK